MDGRKSGSWLANEEHGLRRAARNAALAVLAAVRRIPCVGLQVSVISCSTIIDASATRDTVNAVTPACVLWWHVRITLCLTRPLAGTVGVIGLAL